MDNSTLPPMGKKSTPIDVVRRMVNKNFGVSGGTIRKKKRQTTSGGSNQYGVSGYMKNKNKTNRELDESTK